MKPHVLIVTGYSGAGKTTVLKALEDLDFFCVDNLPYQLIPAFFNHLAQSKDVHARIALGIDVRAGTDIAQVAQIISTYQSSHGNVTVFFLTAHTQDLIKRYQETRRKHPLAHNISLTDAIEQEKQLLKPLMNLSHFIVDTGNFTIHQLRNLVRTTFAQGAGPAMVVNVTSFGFKYGVPQECNYVYDVRSLPNPHFIEELAPLTGIDNKIVDFLFSHSEVQDFWKKMSEFFYFSIKKAQQEGRSFMHIAVGCTGGKHRSVAFVQELAKHSMESVIFLVHHRDIKRELVDEKF